MISTTKTLRCRRTVTNKALQSSPTPTAPPAQKTRGPSKPQLIHRDMTAKGGATMAALVAATGWQPHSIRAAMTGLRKQGLIINLTKIEGITHFTIDQSKGAVL